MRDIETIDSELRASGCSSACGSGAGWAAAIDRRGGGSRGIRMACISGKTTRTVFNLAVGGSGGGDPLNGSYPVDMLIDWIRVF
jgi:hypothetical protein